MVGSRFVGVWWRSQVCDAVGKDLVGNVLQIFQKHSLCRNDRREHPVLPFLSPSKNISPLHGSRSPPSIVSLITKRERRVKEWQAMEELTIFSASASAILTMPLA